MKKLFIRIAKTLALVLAAGLVIQTILLLLSGLAIRRANESLRQAGRPMTPEELIPPEIPDGENAAWLYVGAFDLLRTEGNAQSVLDLNEKYSFLRAVRDVAWDYFHHPERPAARAALEELLKKEVIVDVLRLVEQGAARPRCRFELEYFRGSTLLVNHTHGLLTVNALLRAKALLEANRGEPENAWRTIETMLIFAEALRTEPVILSQAARFGQLDTVSETIQKICAIAMPDDETARRIENALATSDVPTLATAIDFARVTRNTWHMGQTEELWEFEDLLQRRGGITVWTDPYLTLALANRAVRQADRAALLRSLQHLAEAAARPYWETPAQMDWNKELPKYCVFARTLSMDYYLDNQAGTLAKIRITRTGFALMRHKAAHGTYPAALADVDPQFLGETLLDPYSGKPLVYRTEGDGFALYSLGANRQDDGGQENKGSDIIWRLFN